MLGITVLLLCSFYTFPVPCCPIRRHPSRHDIIRDLEELLRKSNGSVFLESTAKFKSDAERHSVQRPVLGGRLALICNIRDTMEEFAHRINQSQYPVWSQDGIRLRLDGHSQKNMPKEIYSCRHGGSLVWLAQFSKAFNWTTGIHTLFLENISQGHAGEYECLGHTPDGYSVIQKHVVSPLLAAADIFYPPMNNVSAVTGSSVQLRCFVKFDQLCGNFDDRFIWRHEDYIIFATGIPVFENAVGATKGFGGSMQGDLNSTYGCHSLLTIRKVDERHAGLYQCWFEIDGFLGEWVVQTVYLSVTN